MIFIPLAPAAAARLKTESLQKPQSHPFAHLQRLRKQFEGHKRCTITGGNVKWCSCCRKQCGGSSKKLSIELPYDPAMPVQDICPKN